ncbi:MULTISPECIES: hypothetical protein [Streptomycetaceae]|uniref:Uncharacterized protein n=1 Tax=Streptantibioticus cattleyicolor (strain ATCC 35852 / DSM 46488 / JCM 4925 / NBRC 14057 / NRRL 8057) TaxID=1003195 RepID=F8JVY6_STREN|nr:MULTISPECIES: hypothetical protein [Streptomycetaceae]AEW92671.1 hypothetical protein SCATT_03000 [Streptantibioticus cattleyicolor NRRL 8057 = DSM 46488]MYS57441.1 hypothetical protein [Streptomyces sp. SID5468]CCB73028.1 protein of unknown function [Streptantibioticus cattleyicolor NRRL 8057 = DSM 46488]
MATPAGTLLTHTLYFEPDPPQAGSSDNADPTLNLLVTNGGWTIVRCTAIALQIPAGSRAKDLVADGSAVGVVSVPEGWSAREPVHTNKFARFTFVPDQGFADIAQQTLRFVLAPVPLNDEVGVAYPHVVETAAPQGQEPAERSVTLRMPKFPAGVRTRPQPGTNLAVFAPGHEEGDAPVVRVAHGASVEVAFTAAPGLARTLHWRDSDRGDPVPDGADRVVCGPLTQDTTFTLQTVSEAGGETVSRYDTVTVAVDVPGHPEVRVVRASAGPQEIALPTSPPAASLTLGGDLDIAAGLDVVGSLTASGPLTASALSGASLDYAGTVTAPAPLDVDALAAGTLAATGGLTATGTVRMMRAGREELSSSGGTRVADTDGLLVATARGTRGPVHLAVTGKPTFRTTTRNGDGALVAPVHADTRMSWAVEGDVGEGEVRFYWFALGL